MEIEDVNMRCWTAKCHQYTHFLSELYTIASKNVSLTYLLTLLNHKQIDCDHSATNHLLT